MPQQSNGLPAQQGPAVPGQPHAGQGHASGVHQGQQQAPAALPTTSASSNLAQAMQRQKRVDHYIDRWALPLEHPPLGCIMLLLPPRRSWDGTSLVSNLIQRDSLQHDLPDEDLLPTWVPPGMQGQQLLDHCITRCAPATSLQQHVCNCAIQPSRDCL